MAHLSNQSVPSRRSELSVGQVNIPNRTWSPLACSGRHLLFNLDLKTGWVDMGRGLLDLCRGVGYLGRFMEYAVVLQPYGYMFSD